MEAIINQIFKEQPEAVKKKAISFLIGCVMRKTKGASDLDLIRAKIEEGLEQ